MASVILPVCLMMATFTAFPAIEAQPPARPPARITPDILNQDRPQTLADFQHLSKEIRDIVGREFYDAKRAGEWVKTHRDYAAKVTDAIDFAEKTNQALAELNTSHTYYYSPRDTNYYALLSIFQEALGIEKVEYDSIGADFARLEEGYFVRQVFAGSPAEKAGLQRGDRILPTFDPVGTFGGRAGKGVLLKVMQRPGDVPRQIRIFPRRVSPKQEWLAAQKSGSRVIVHDGRRIGYVPLFSGAGDEYRDAVQEAILTKFQNADALFLDFRNGFGGMSPDFMNLFNPLVPTLTSTGRDGRDQSFSGVWRKPLFVLINGGSRSGKEVIAATIKKRKIGTLIGERTAGAVVGGRVFLLSDRSALYLAVRDVRVDGERLEGRGVEPDVAVPDTLPYAMGADPQLEKALSLAAATVMK